MHLKFNFKMLFFGGLIAGLTAIWHLLMILGGPDWYIFAHAPGYIVESARQYTFIAPFTAVLIAGLMLTCTVYSFSGAGLIRELPLLKSALITISIVCLMRALVAVPYLISTKIDILNMVAAFGWFLLEFVFLLGVFEKYIKNKSE